MRRLTKKQGDLYYPTNENIIFPDDGSNAIRLLQVIEKYEGRIVLETDNRRNELHKIEIYDDWRE